jgi:23S rRNA A1618 N6-methylase RlmF
MHPRSPYYEKQTDFNDLADYYPPMKPLFSSNLHKSTDKTVSRIHKSTLKTRTHSGDKIILRVLISRQLTKALLKRDFELEIDLPDDRLCPPVSPI